MISAGDTIIRKDSRMKLIEQSLEISNVTDDDAGEYICNVETFGAPLDQVHRLTVLVAPSIEALPRDGVINVKEGSSVSLSCQVTGTPTPRLRWSREVRIYPLYLIFI